MAGNRMGENANSSSPLWLPKKDKSGAVLKKNLSDAALKGWNRMRDYAAREHVDSSFAADIVESIVKNMSAARRRPSDGAIRNPESYIVGRFMRRIKGLLVKERRIEYLANLTEVESLKPAQDWDWPLRLENTIQAKEVIKYMDERTRRTCLRRTQGFTWKNIASKQGVSVNTAIKSYERGLARVQKLLTESEGKSQGGRPGPK